MSALAVPFVDKRRRVITTPEGLTLPLTIASRGARAGALILDVMIILFALIAFHIALIAVAGGLIDNMGSAFSAAPSGAAEFLQILLIIGVFLSWYGYFLVQELGPRGATLGKRILGIRIAAREQARLTPEAVIARNLLRDIEVFYPLIFILVTASSVYAGDGSGVMIWAAAGWFGLFLLMPFFNRDALRAGDIIAGTWVVEAPRMRLAEALSARRLEPAGENPAPARAPFTAQELSVYGERELQVLERVLREGGSAGLAAVHTAIAAKIGREPQAGDERAFLEAFYAALRAKLEKDMRFGTRKADKYS